MKLQVRKLEVPGPGSLQVRKLEVPGSQGSRTFPSPATLSMGQILISTCTENLEINGLFLSAGFHPW